jgi:hypothetical protein
MKQRTQRNTAKIIKFNLRNRISWRGKYMRLARKESTAIDASNGCTPVSYMHMHHDRIDLIHGDGYTEEATSYARRIESINAHFAI